MMTEEFYLYKNGALVFTQKSSTFIYLNLYFLRYHDHRKIFVLLYCPLLIIDKIIHNKVFYRKLVHFHRMPRLPFN